MPAWLTPPNVLSGLRIVVAPWLGVQLAQGNFRIALPVLFLTGISDGLDGYLARRFNWQSALGEKLDPVADKVLAATLYICFAWKGLLPWGVSALVLGRDGLILAFAAVALLLGRARRFPPSIWGKLSTACQLLLAGACVMRAGWPNQPPAFVFEAVLWVTVAATVWSGLAYFRTGLVLMRRNGD
ncbi:MAG: CDP-alcohol phosphatidyltransferase family protein [Bryobacteraceae bacterium]|nr:CDP-alcohol phosphatidyltransferase family protein [Bryobacteraceae bacterium]